MRRQKSNCLTAEVSLVGCWQSIFFQNADFLFVSITYSNVNNKTIDPNYRADFLFYQILFFIGTLADKSLKWHCISERQNTYIFIIELGLKPIRQTSFSPSVNPTAMQTRDDAFIAVRLLANGLNSRKDA